MKNKTQQTFWQKTKRFFEPFGNDKKLYTIACFTYFISAFNIAVYILFIEGIISTLESGNQESFYQMIFYFVVYYIVYLFLKISLRKSGWPAHSTTARKFIQNIYIPKFIKLDNNQIEKLGTGKIIAILDKGVVVWGNLFHHFFENGIRILTSLVFTMYMVGKSSTLLLGVFILLYICIYVCAMYLNLGTLKYRRKRRDWGNRHTKHLVKIIMSKNEVLFTNRTNGELEALDGYFDNETFYNKKMTNFMMPMFELPRTIISVLIVFVLYYFGSKYFAGDLQLSEIVGLTTTFLVMLNTISQGTEFFKNFTKDFTDVEKLWDFFDTTPQIEGYEEGNIFQHTTGAISLKNVNYGYDEAKPVFQDFSLDIAGQKVTALVGASGGGKSTLVKLISGYIRQDSGDILVDDQNLKETSLKSYYADVGYLTQEPSVFDGTILENLMYAVTEQTPLSDSLQTPSSQFFSLGGEDEAANGQKNAAPFSSKGERIQDGGDGLGHIIQLANCEFIYDLPNGLDTEIGERGVKLSGGQKQRLAIAKIFIKDPKIIILDEPTSALDSLSEQKITKAMHNLFENRTVLVIAHRLQTVKHADDIIVIEGGEVRERGTHESLVNQDGFYKQMLDLQSGF